MAELKPTPAIAEASGATDLPPEELTQRFETFIRSLHRSGYSVSPDLVAASLVILAEEYADRGADLGRLKYRLTPIFATDRASKIEISSRIDDFVAGLGRSTPYDQRAETAVRTRRRLYGLLILAVTLIIVFVSGAYLYHLATTDPPPPPAPSDPEQVAPDPSPEQDWPVIPFDERVRVYAESEIVIHERIWADTRAPVIIVATLLPLLLATIWWRLRTSRRQLWMRLAGLRADDPDPARARMYADRGIPISNEVQSIGEDLGTSAEEECHRLDINRTVVRTARAAGFLTPVLEKSRGQTDYVVLIERKNANDHLARLIDTLLDRIEAQGIRIRRFYYQDDPRYSRSADGGIRTRSFRQLVNAFGSHRFVVIGSSAGFFNPVTGKLHEWKEIETFASRTLLNARPRDHWDYREEELLSTGFLLGSATPQGFVAYGRAVAGGHDLAGAREIEARDPGHWRPEPRGTPPRDRSAETRQRFPRLQEVLEFRKIAPRREDLRRAVEGLAQFWTPLGVVGALAALILPLGLWLAGALNPNRATEPVTPPRELVVPASPRTPLSTFRDCDVCPEMVVIPAGSFLMGSPEDEEGRDRDEGPQHRREIASFALARTEVTFDQWQACVDGGGCKGNPSPNDGGWGRGDRPVITVSWNDAQEYIAWLNSMVDGDPYRLPSEAEWEYAARAGTTTAYSFGDGITAEQASFGRSFDEGTTPVGAFPANDFKLHDMHGNVWEWVEDCWHDSYEGAPPDDRAWLSEQNGNCGLRVLRGGSWYINPRGLRSAFRNGYVPVNRDDNVGFRPARTLTP